MRISDWSSDVCSSDLIARQRGGLARGRNIDGGGTADRIVAVVISSRQTVCARYAGRDRLRCRLGGSTADISTRCARIYPAFDGARKGDTAVAGGIGGQRRHYSGLALSQLRSEEHTSELQSLMRISYAVFCLKKKKNKQQKKLPN